MRTGCVVILHLGNVKVVDVAENIGITYLVDAVGVVDVVNVLDIDTVAAVVTSSQEGVAGRRGCSWRGCQDVTFPWVNERVSWPKRPLHRALENNRNIRLNDTTSLKSQVTREPR